MDTKNAQRAYWCSFHCYLEKCSIKLILKALLNVFELIFHQMQSSYYKSHFYSLFKPFLVKENSKVILENIKKINCNANAKAVLKFDFCALYIKLPQFYLISVLNDTIEPHLKGTTKKR